MGRGAGIWVQWEVAGDAGCGAGVPPVLAGPWLLHCCLTVDGDKKGEQAALPGQKGCAACSWQQQPYP